MCFKEKLCGSDFTVQYTTQKLQESLASGILKTSWLEEVSVYYSDLRESELYLVLLQLISTMYDIIPRLCPSIATTFLISIGYIDPGKWAAAVEGGARFGFDLILLVFIFNCTAILCQSLAARVSVVTGKNLAQICCEEYKRPICLLLGVQTVISVIALDLTMILGIAHGLNLLIGLDLFTCVLFTAIDAIIFPLTITFSDKWKPAIFACIAGFLLLFYVLGVLIGQPDIPIVVNGMLPRVRRESLYTLMSLLGANIMPHSFYFHSSFVQQQRRLPGVSMSAVCHDHFLAITFTFSLIFLVNYAVMSSSVTVFHSAGLTVLSFQDAVLLMDQVFRSPMAQFAFFLVLFLSSQITSLTSKIGRQAILHAFFGVDQPPWVYHATNKALAIILALYCVWNSGFEGVYQLLIFSQVILALQLPSAMVPLFRIASSNSIMGSFKISRSVELLSLFAFLGILALNILFIAEILFGDSEWIGNLMWSMGSIFPLPYVFVLVHAFGSIGLMLWLAAIPRNSSSDSSDVQERIWDPQGSLSANDKEVTGVRNMKNARDEEPIEEQPALKNVLESGLEFDSPIIEDHSLSEAIVVSDEPDPSDITKDSTISSPNLSESAYLVEAKPETTDNMIPSGNLSDGNAAERTVPEDPAAGSFEQVDIGTEKDNDEVDVWEPEEPSGGASGPILNEVPGSFRSLSGKSEEGGSGSGSLSRLSGLGRAARRQLAAILDEFWGQLYDFHGHFTEEAKSKRVNMLLGIDLKSIGASVKAGPTRIDTAVKYFQEVEKESIFMTNSRDYDFSTRKRSPIGFESSYMLPVGSGSSSCSSHMQTLDAYAKTPNRNLIDTEERRYSSLHLPPHSDGQDLQPAMIHGFPIASYPNRSATNRNPDPINMPLDQPVPESTSFAQNYRELHSYTSGQSVLGASLHTASMQRQAVSRIQMERPYNNLSSLASNDNVGSKKYHSLPDITGFNVSNFISSSRNRNPQWNNPGQVPSMGKMGFKQSSYSHNGTKAERTPLAFDQLSPSKLHRDAFSLQSSSNLETNSLWYRQPFEELFGKAGKAWGGEEGLALHLRMSSQERISPADSEAELLQALRLCIMKLLKLEGSDWLFRQNGGMEEELIDRVAARERFRLEAEASELGHAYMVSGPSEDLGISKFLTSSVPHCGEDCIWRVELIVSFGVWCIHRILELSLMESRPELWGKYTYVLNRLQGILDPAFSHSRPPYSPCQCLHVPAMSAERPMMNGLFLTAGKASKARSTSASTLLDIIKDVETAVFSRKGRTGTAAGDVAFPKGKENLASVLKRYKRRLSHKPSGIYDGGVGSRKVRVGPSPSFPS